MQQKDHQSDPLTRALVTALLESKPPDLANPETSSAEHDPLAGRWFISLKKFEYLFDVGETHARELLKTLDPPVRRSGRRLLIPVLGVRRLADALPKGFGQEPESARRGREARRLDRPMNHHGNVPGGAGENVPTDQRVLSGEPLPEAGHPPAPPLPASDGSHRGQPDHAAKESTKNGKRRAAAAEVI